MRLPVNRAVPLAALIFLSGCGYGGSHNVAQLPPLPANGPAADYPMVIGDPFTIDGVTYTPNDRLNYDELGYASVGRGEGTAVTAAHKTLPLPSYIEVTSLASGMTILVRVENRGPMTNDYLVELSPAAADQLGISRDSKAAVRVRRVNPPESDRALLRADHYAPERMETPKPLLEVLKRKLAAQEPLSRPDYVVPVSSSAAQIAERTPKAALPTEPTIVAPPSPEPAEAPAEAQVPLTPEPSPKPVPAKEPEPSPGPVIEPTTKAAPAPKPSPKAETASAAKPATARTLRVQVATFSASDRAEKVAAKLGGTVTKSGNFWLVRLGPFATQAEAKAALAKAKAAGYSDARILRAD